jgi:hypothetical protein
MNNYTFIQGNNTTTGDIDLPQVFSKLPVKNVIFKNICKNLRLNKVANPLLGYGKLDNGIESLMRCQ